MATPQANPHSGATSAAGRGRGTCHQDAAEHPGQVGQGEHKDRDPAGDSVGAPEGSAASIGNSGSGPSAAPVGATTVEAPNANPGPSE